VVSPELAGWPFGVTASGTIEGEAISASFRVKRLSSFWVEEQEPTINQFFVLTGSGNVAGVPTNETACVSKFYP